MELIIVLCVFMWFLILFIVFRYHTLTCTHIGLESGIFSTRGSHWHTRVFIFFFLCIIMGQKSTLYQWFYGQFYFMLCQELCIATFLISPVNSMAQWVIFDNWLRKTKPIQVIKKRNEKSYQMICWESAFQKTDLGSDFFCWRGLILNEHL